LEFERVLGGIFGKDLMKHYREKCPIGWVDLMIAFESRKRSASPHKPTPHNVSLPFSFIDYCKKHKVRPIMSIYLNTFYMIFFQHIFRYIITKKI
jgi:hypothetical protein